jgi:hypothetical protein
MIVNGDDDVYKLLKPITNGTWRSTTSTDVNFKTEINSEQIMVATRLEKK